MTQTRGCVMTSDNDELTVAAVRSDHQRTEDHDGMRADHHYIEGGLEGITRWVLRETDSTAGSDTVPVPGLADPLLATGLPHYRIIVAVDIECSTSRPD